MAKKKIIKNVVKRKAAVKKEPTVSGVSLENNMVSNGSGNGLGLDFGPNGWGVQLSQTTTMEKNLRYYLVSNNRNLLNYSYVEHGLIQTIVDLPIDDGFRGGVDIKAKQLSEDNIIELQAYMERAGDLEAIAQTNKWNRLFGGAGTVIMTGQDPTSPLDLKRLKYTEELAFEPADMWELFYSQINITDDARPIPFIPLSNFDYYGIQLNPERVMLMRGMAAPSFIRPRLRGWGLSVVEALIRSINQYLKSNNLTFEVLDEFKLDIFKIDGLANTLLQQGGEALVQQRIGQTNRQKNYMNAISMDAKDDYVQKQLSFAGLAEAQAGIRMQVASDMRMPLTKLFGISAAGFNSGEDDIENYNAMVESQVRSKVKYEIIRVIELRCMQIFGFIPDDISITFKPLRILAAPQEEEVKTSKLNRMVIAYDRGLMTPQEFKEGCNKDSLLSVQLDPTIDVLPVAGTADDTGDLGGEDEANVSKIKAKETKEDKT